MHLTFHGAARGVTGSRHLLEINGAKILLDCGFFQGRREETNRRNREFGFDPKSIDAVVLSHAHIDHSGALPSLVKHGFVGPVYATPATADLAKIMLADSAFIQEKDAEMVLKYEGRRIEPIYTSRDVVETQRRFKPVEYWRSIEIALGVRLTFHEAGHMLGSSVVRLELSSTGKKRSLLFSGDYGRAAAPILRSPEVLEDADAIIVESTYGNRHHPKEQDLIADLEKLVRRIVDRGGKLIIPAFSVGRTQHLTYALNILAEDNRLPDLPIFVDSPLAKAATEIFRQHPECYNPETRRQMQSEPDRDILMFRRLRFTESAEESKRLNELGGSAIIISASGMCESGRILHHIFHHGQSERNCILFVGYQAEGTLGRRILDGQRRIRLHGREMDLRAEVLRMEGFSAHADRDELEKFVTASRRGLKDAFVVHGEPEQSDAFAGWVKDHTGARTIAPALGMRVSL